MSSRRKTLIQSQSQIGSAGPGHRASVSHVSFSEFAAGMPTTSANVSNGSVRKMSVMTQGDRRRSSAACFLDYESTTKAFLDAQVRLGATSRQLTELESKHKELLTHHRELQTRYVNLQQDALESALVYSLDKSNDFKHVPKQNPDLLETETRVGEYIMSDVINKGHFSVVRRCSKCPPLNGSSRKQSLANVVYTLAVKSISKESLTCISSVLALENELRAMKELHHPNILALKEAMHGAQNVYMITECIECDLFEFLEANQHLINDNIVSVVLREIATGLAHVHANRVVHRDLKSENILVEFTAHASRHNQITIKICDFGMCIFGPETTSILGEFAGSPGFFAPETILHSAFCGFKADVFSLGSIALELLVSQTFFNKQWVEAAYEQRSKEAHVFSTVMRNSVLAAHKEVRRCHAISELNDFVIATLSFEAASRPTASYALQSPWIQSANMTAACEVLSQRKKDLHRRHALIPRGLPLAGGGGRPACVGSLPVGAYQGMRDSR